MTSTADEGQQPALPGMPAPREPSRKAGSKGAGKGAAGASGIEPAEHLPVAQVSIDVAPPHLDRPFDYLVPQTMADGAQPGTRVKVRFAGRDVDGIILRRLATSEHQGALTPLRRLVSDEVVLTPQVAALCRAVADLYAGTFTDVVRLAVPPRHARTEASVPRVPDGAASEAAAQAPGAPATPATTGSPGASATPATPGSPGASATSGSPGASATPGPPGTSATTAAPGATGGPATDQAPATPPTPDAPTRPGPEPTPSAWAPYTGGAAFLRHMQAGNAPRAVWSALPGAWADGTGSLPPGCWERALAEAVRAAASAGRGALVVLPDRRDVDRLTAALEALGLHELTTSGGDFARLLADDGPALRYRSFLAVLRGHVRIAIGTRAAALAPVRDLGLAVCWDDAESTHREQRAPYPHVREVLALRSELERCAYLVGSVARTVEAQALLASGWAREISAPRAEVRSRAPRVRVLDSVELASEGPAAAARIPTPAWRLIRDALASGPVLVQVPRSGYVPVVACQRCREPARCTACHGPLGFTRATGEPQCRWCGQLAAAWRCPECGGTQLRSISVGSERTAEELGRAFPGVTVKVSGARSSSGVLAQVTSKPALVVATPGAEPVAAGGYRAGILLDAAVTAAGSGLHAGQDALHRWFVAARLVRPAVEGGQVLLVGDVPTALSGPLVRWDPAGYADRDLSERTTLGLPPAVRAGAVTGDRTAVESVLRHAQLGEGWKVLGPIELPREPEAPGTLMNLAGTQVRAVVTAPRAQGRALALALRAAAAVRSARREGTQVQVRMDPVDLL